VRPLLVCALALTLLCGCGGQDSGGQSTAPATPPATAPVASVKPVIPPAGSPSPDPNFGQGQAIFITDKGFVPAWLVARVNRSITWVNQTDHAVGIRFDNLGPEAPAPQIVAGGAWGWRPTASVSVLYHDSADPKVQGKIQVEPGPGT
jgi:hypothetical protein